MSCERVETFFSTLLAHKKDETCISERPKINIPKNKIFLAWVRVKNLMQKKKIYVHLIWKKTWVTWVREKTCLLNRLYQLKNFEPFRTWQFSYPPFFSDRRFFEDVKTKTGWQGLHVQTSDTTLAYLANFPSTPTWRTRSPSSRLTKTPCATAVQSTPQTAKPQGISLFVFKPNIRS